MLAKPMFFVPTKQLLVRKEIYIPEYFIVREHSHMRCPVCDTGTLLRDGSIHERYPKDKAVPNTIYYTYTAVRCNNDDCASNDYSNNVVHPHSITMLVHVYEGINVTVEVTTTSVNYDDTRS